MAYDFAEHLLSIEHTYVNRTCYFLSKIVREIMRITIRENARSTMSLAASFTKHTVVTVLLSTTFLLSVLFTDGCRCVESYSQFSKRENAQKPKAWWQNRVKECILAFFQTMSPQLDIIEKMRAILIDWLIEVHLKFGLMHDTIPSNQSL
ncbi:hypothetical protein SUGI_1040330 [Cryptomeria japonica]|nr:hypothetical protein SUGI_1040330 [Cryptomeria japonica]